MRTTYKDAKREKICFAFSEENDKILNSPLNSREESGMIARKERGRPP